MSETDQPTPKRRGGRPSLGKRGTFTFRVTDTLRSKLEAEAEKIGRPVSEVIESRLEQSFFRSSSISQGAEHLGKVAELVVALVEAKMEQEWVTSADTARYTFNRLLLALRRTMKVAAVADLPEAEREMAAKIEEAARARDEAEERAQAEERAKHGSVLARLLRSYEAPKKEP